MRIETDKELLYQGHAITIVLHSGEEYRLIEDDFTGDLLIRKKIGRITVRPIVSNEVRFLEENDIYAS